MRPRRESTSARLKCASANRRIAGERPSRQFAGLSDSLEDAGVRAGFLDRHLHLIAAVGGQLDHDRVRFVSQVAIRIGDFEEDLITGLHLILRTDLSPATAFVVLLLFLASQLL